MDTCKPQSENFLIHNSQFMSKNTDRPPFVMGSQRGELTLGTHHVKMLGYGSTIYFLNQRGNTNQLQYQ